jgi:hypothetical protein
MALQLPPYPLATACHLHVAIPPKLLFAVVRGTVILDHTGGLDKAVATVV